MRNGIPIAVGWGLMLSALPATPENLGWDDLAGLRFSVAKPRFETAVAENRADERSQLGLALSLWAGQPTRGPDFDEAVTMLRKIADSPNPSDPELAAAARFLWGRASWLGGDETTATRVFESMAASMESVWAERAAVARIQMAVTNLEPTSPLLEQAETWLAGMSDEVARQGMHLALAEAWLVYERDAAAGVAHLEEALAEEKMGLRLRADTLLSAGRLLAEREPARAAKYLQRFREENPLDGRRQLAGEVLDGLQVIQEGSK